jgi:PAT family beta-lactamase induction signal transducer AmpG
MPVSSSLPYEWYDTPNIHLCTVADFDAFLAERRLDVMNRVVLAGGPRRQRAAEPPGGARDLPVPSRVMTTSRPLLTNKLFWVGILYFAEGYPLGVFYELFPVYFRQQGVELRQIGVLSLLGLAWTLKFLWAPAIDYWRHHRRWMAAVDVAMGGAMLYFAMQAGFGPAVWLAIGAFTALSATNDVAIDGYTIEYLEQDELGLANGIRIGMYRVGMLASGFVLMASEWLGWRGAFMLAGGVFFALAAACLLAPRERGRTAPRGSVHAEFAALARSPYALAILGAFMLGVIWLIDGTTKWSSRIDGFWWYAAAVAAVAVGTVAMFGRFAQAPALPDRAGLRPTEELARGPVFGALMELLRRPSIVPVLVFILLFKLPDAAMGFMVKPFWVDVGFSAAQIGLVSVNIGLGLSIAGGIVGGWITDRIGIFKSLWMLGIAQAASNLGYWIAAGILPSGGAGLERAGRAHGDPLCGERDRIVHRRARHCRVSRVPDGDRREGAGGYRVRAPVVGVRAVAFRRGVGRGARRAVDGLRQLVPADVLPGAPRLSAVAMGAAHARSQRGPPADAGNRRSHWLAVTPPST